MLYSNEPGGAMRIRPENLHDDEGVIDLSDFSLDGLIDGKAVHVSTSWDVGGGRIANAMEVVVRRMTIGHVVASKGAVSRSLHLDALLLNGKSLPARPAMTIPSRPNLLLEDVIVHDCGPTRNVQTILVKDGAWGTVHLRRVFEVRNATGIYLWGPIHRVRIDDSPGINVNLQGAPGSIGGVIVRRCPGCLVQNVKDEHGVHPNAPIDFTEAHAWPRPAVASVAVSLTDGSTFNLKGAQ